MFVCLASLLGSHWIVSSLFCLGQFKLSFLLQYNVYLIYTQREKRRVATWKCKLENGLCERNLSMSLKERYHERRQRRNGKGPEEYMIQSRAQRSDSAKFSSLLANKGVLFAT